MESNSGAGRKKIFAIAIVAIVVVASLGVVAFLFIDRAGAVEYTGVMVAKSMVSNSYDDGYQFTGRPSDDPDAALRSFTVTGTSGPQGVTGGRFLIQEDDGIYSYEGTVSADSVPVNNDQVPSMMDDIYANIELTMTSISLVCADYTFGIGVSGNGDFIWVAPHASYPTFFNQIEVQGTIMDRESLQAMATDLHTTFLDEVNLQYVLELAADLDLAFDGRMDRFIMIDHLEYAETVQVRGDVIDTITPRDLQGLSDAFSPSGMEWIKDILGNIGQGCALVSEEHSTICHNELWIVLFPLDMVTGFDGICQLEVSESSFSLIDLKMDLDRTCFEPFSDSVSFVVNLGVMVEVQGSTYTDMSVPFLWGKMDVGVASQVDSVKITGYGVVVDYQTLSDCLGQALGVDEAAGGLTALSSFKNPAFVFLLDQDFSVFADDDVSIWRYATVCIVPDYMHDSSAFRYLSVEGTAYDLGHYFGSTSPIFNIPLIIADDCREGAASYQQVCIKDMRAGALDHQNIGGQNGAFVEFDAKPIGTSLLTLFSVAGGISSLASKLLPVDLGFYIAFQRDGDGLHYVPVIYLSAGKGSSYFGTHSVDIRGVYIDFSHHSSTVDRLVDEASEDETGSMTSTLGMVLAFSMDHIKLELSDAVAYGPASATEETFNVRYSMDPSLLDDPGMKVELYWTNDDDPLWNTWNYYGRDPTPGDGLFPVDYGMLDGDGQYGWFIRVKNAAHQADDNAPGMWDNAETKTRVNVLDPLPVHNKYPLAPAPGTSLVLRWESSDDVFFDHYEVFYGYDPDFTPSHSNRLKIINEKYTTQWTVTGLSSGQLYYFTIRVVDDDGHYSDSNVNFTRTYQNVDTPDSDGPARVVMAGTAWTEDTTMWLDEEDLFAIYLLAGESLTVDMIGNTMGGGDLYAYGVNGQLITSSTLPGVTESVHLTATVSGYYYVMVTTPTVGTDWYTLWFHVG